MKGYVLIQGYWIYLCGIQVEYISLNYIYT